MGKPVVMPGLPELASLVGQMAAQWEHKAQQKALQQMGMDNAEATTTHDTAAAAASGEPATAVVQQLALANAEATTVDEDVATAAAATHGMPATAVEDVPPSNTAAGVAGMDVDQEGAAVDANADATVDDALVDAKAASIVAGVAAEAPNADAAEARRQQQKTPKQ